MEAGPVAVVTGGGRGIGRAIALGLATAGARVAVVARTTTEVEESASLIRAAGGVALAIPADVTEWAEVEAAVGGVEAELGPVELLVNNAGTHLTVGPVWEADPELWWRDVESSLRSAWLCSRAVLPRMIARGRGRIVNLSSGAALEPRPFSSAYSCAKAAVLRLTDSLAAAVLANGLQVFAIHPGGVRTALTERILNSPAGQAAYPEWPQLAWTPPERAAALVVALASGRADALSGRYFDASEDFERVLGERDAVVRDDLYALRLRRLPVEGAQA